jgi:hypothetical protein
MPVDDHHQHGGLVGHRAEPGRPGFCMAYRRPRADDCGGLGGEDVAHPHARRHADRPAPETGSGAGTADQRVLVVVTVAVAQRSDGPISPAGTSSRVTPVSHRPHGPPRAATPAAPAPSPGLIIGTDRR